MKKRVSILLAFMLLFIAVAEVRVLGAVASNSGEVAVTHQEQTAQVVDQRITTATIGLRMRTGPSSSYSVIRLLPYHTVVEFLESAGSWSKIRHAGTIGYASNAYLETVPVAEPDPTSELYLTTAEAGLRMRSGPSTSYSVIRLLPYNTKVKLLGITGTWSRIEHSGTTGYVSSKFLKKADGTPDPAPMPVTTVYVTTGSVNFRTGPGTSYSVIRKLSGGVEIQVISISGKWAKAIQGGTTGYLSTSYIRLKDTVGKPKIGLAWVPSQTSLYTRTVDAVVKAGGEVVHLSRVYDKAGAEAQLARVDGLVFTGGSDIHPKYYGETPVPTYPRADLDGISAARDVSDYNLAMAAIRQDVASLGLCRGAQVLNVAAGGTLIQDIPSETESRILHRDPNRLINVYHDIEISGGSLLADIMGAGTLNVNSWHHQAVDRLGASVVSVAASSDGISEAFEITGKTFILGLQFHPETHIKNGDMKHLEIFKKLVEFSR